METTQQDWLAWRKLGIGSSDAATLHNAPGAYMTPLELYEEKLSTDLSQKPANWAMSQGNEFEITARRLFSAQYNMENGTDETFEQKWFVLKDLEVIRASVDGCSKDGRTITEFKFQGIENHKKVSNETLPIRGGRVIEKYWIQCQHGLLASGAEFCVFGSYNPKEPKNVRTCVIMPDVEFQKLHIDAVAKFWKAHILKRKAPPESARDYKALRKKGAKGIAKKWAALQVRADQIAIQMADLRTQLIEMADAEKHPRLVCGPVQLQKIARAGSIDYKNIPAVKEMTTDDLDKYRKDGSSSWRMEVPNEPIEIKY